MVWKLGSRVAREGETISIFTRDGMLVAAILAIASAKVAVGVGSGGDLTLVSASESKDIMVHLDAKEKNDEVAAGTGSMEQMDNEDAGDMENIDKMDSAQLKEKVKLLLVALQEKESRIAELEGERRPVPTADLLGLDAPEPIHRPPEKPDPGSCNDPNYETAMEMSLVSSEDYKTKTAACSAACSAVLSVAQQAAQAAQQAEANLAALKEHQKECAKRKAAPAHKAAPAQKTASAQTNQCPKAGCDGQCTAEAMKACGAMKAVCKCKKASVSRRSSIKKCIVECSTGNHRGTGL